jgi:hypothetical protein
VDIQLISQILGLLALAVSVLGHQIKMPKVALVFLCLASVFWAFHFGLLGQVAVFTTALNAIRSGLAVVIPDKFLKYVVMLHIVFAYILMIPNIEFAYDVLPLLAVTVISIGILNRKRGFVFRRMFFLGEALWFAYAASVLSVPMMAACLFSMSSISVSMLRCDFKLQKGAA